MYLFEYILIWMCTYLDVYMYIYILIWIFRIGKTYCFFKNQVLLTFINIF